MSEETNLDTLSNEEIQKLIDNRKKFLKDQLPVLRIEDEYYRLKANIAENKLRELMSKMKQASLQAPKPQEEFKEEDFASDENQKKEES